eukprot:1386457-Amorphochlora_amoeboformis.AAC.1
MSVCEHVERIKEILDATWRFQAHCKAHQIHFLDSIDSTSGVITDDDEISRLAFEEGILPDGNEVGWESTSRSK